MNITICFDDIEPEPWIVGFKKVLPDANVSVWQSGSPLADYAVVWNPTQQFIDEQHKVKAIFNIGAGVEGLLQLKLPENIKIIRLDSDSVAIQMAEYVCHEVMRQFRDFKYYESQKQLGKWSYRKTKNREDFAVGVMGLGTLGMQVIKILQMFGYPVNAYSRTPKEIQGVNCFNGILELKEFLNNTRILVNLLPLTPETENILNRNNLSQLKPNGYVINVARGKHLVDQDLLDLINDGHLSGATLDVFRQEPLPADSPFWHHPKVTVTPHMSARATREEIVRQIVSKISNLQTGKEVSGLVDRIRGY